MTRVGWIGLGAMGAPMAACVARAGHEVVAFDVDPARAADGVSPAETVADAAAAEVLVLMVATPDQVEDVLFGDGAAAAALQPRATVVITATVGPAPVQDWAERLRAVEVEVVDAPVSGGVARAGDGDLLIMVSGKPRGGRARPGVARRDGPQRPGRR